MATSSEVKAGLDDIAQSIRNARRVAKQCVAQVTAAEAELNAIPTTFSGLITTIDGYSAGTTDSFEKLAKDEKDKLAAEFTSLKTKLTNAKNGLSAIDWES